MNDEAAMRKNASPSRFYWENMRSFRDQYAAHRELGFNQPVPRFDRALEAAFCYEEWIREMIRPDVVAGPTLRRLFPEWEKAVTVEVLAALAALTLKARIRSQCWHPLPSVKHARTPS